VNGREIKSAQRTLVVKHLSRQSLDDGCDQRNEDTEIKVETAA
jgi:hypothetical protein